MDITLGLRRAKWFVQGTREGGKRDFRRLGIARIQEFTGARGLIVLAGWAYLFKTFRGSPDLEVLDNDTVVYRSTLEWLDSPDAVADIGKDECAHCGFRAYLNYEADHELDVRLRFMTPKGAFYLAVGQAQKTTRDSVQTRVFDPWENGQLGCVDGDAKEQNVARERARQKIEELPPALVILSHLQGGGAGMFLDGQLVSIRQSETPVALVVYSPFDGLFHMRVQHGQDEFQVSAVSLESLLDLFANPCGLWINELVSYPQIEDVLEAIVSFVNRTGAPCRMYVHDYYSICPSITLITPDGFTCNACPNPADCSVCYQQLGFPQLGFSATLQDYQSAWRKVLESCSEIVCFSQSSLKLMKANYPELEAIVVRPHEVAPLETVDRSLYDHKGTRIGFLGDMGFHKGGKIVDSLIASNTDPSVSFTLIGSIVDGSVQHPLACTGSYERNELPRLIAQEQIDVFFLASVCPETFSYTCSEAILTGVPVVAFNLGALEDKVSAYEKGLVVPVETPVDELLAAIVRHAEAFKE